MSYAVRVLTAKDADPLDAFLAPHTPRAYFLRSNARFGGLDYHGEPMQGVFLAAYQNGRMVGVISYTWINTVLICVEDPLCLPALAHALYPFVLGRDGVIDGFLGLPGEVDAFVQSYRIPDAAFRFNTPDFVFTLDIAHLRTPPCAGDEVIRLADVGDHDLLVDWRVDYNIEAVGSAPGPALRQNVETEIRGRIERKELLILEKDGTPVSFCGIAGSLPDCMMVGPVWTPPALRGRGYASLITALGISYRKAERPSLTHMCLFASRPDAIRVYEKTGFKRLCPWSLALLREDYRIEECAGA